MENPSEGVASQSAANFSFSTSDAPPSDLMSRPARKQVKKGQTGPRRDVVDHASADYNIWYHKRPGNRFQQDEKEKASSRCNPTLDTGYTRADKLGRETYICLYFARGHCMHGSNCTYYHRIPTDEDEMRLDITHDVFGRERHRTYREDMGGVGSFSRENRTLYISGLSRGNNMEEVIRRHFGEFGEIESVKVLWEKGISFIKFKLRATAEFAKEAMQDQSLDGNEILNIRWANDDLSSAAAEKRSTEPSKAQKDQLKTAIEKRKEQERIANYTPIGASIAYPVVVNQDPSSAYQYYGSSGSEVFGYDPYGADASASSYQQTNPSYDGTEVLNWLKEIEGDLSEYSNSFSSAGIFDLQSVTQLDDIQLDAMGIANEEHRKKLLEAAKKTAEKLEEQAKAAQEQYQQYYAQQYYQQHPQYMYSNEEYKGEDEK